MKKPKRRPPPVPPFATVLPVVATFLQLLIELVKRW